jgi:hypothetical protein
MQKTIECVECKKNFQIVNRDLIFRFFGRVVSCNYTDPICMVSGQPTKRCQRTHEGVRIGILVCFRVSDFFRTIAGVLEHDTNQGGTERGLIFEAPGNKLCSKDIR